MDPYGAAEHALSAGDATSAIRYGWRAATSAARVQDESTLTQIATLADRAAALLVSTQPAQAADAERLADYCRACLLEPRSPADGLWGLGRLFHRGQDRKECPDCAESIAARARVCRFCGYRYPDPVDR